MQPNTITTWSRWAHPDFTALPARFWQWVVLCHQRHRQRAHLATLVEHALKDIGVSRARVAQTLLDSMGRRSK